MNGHAIAPCPHCGKQDHTYTNVRPYGWVQEYYDLEGKYESLDLDRMQATTSATMRCASCGKIRRDVERDGINIRMKARTDTCGEGK